LKRVEDMGGEEEFDVNSLDDYNFPMLEYTNKQLINHALTILEKEKYLSSLKIDKSLVINLLNDIASNYNIVPYHHFTHAFSVFQVFFQK
jgi:cAMP-specific phosphodiesterase 4